MIKPETTAAFDDLVDQMTDIVALYDESITNPDNSQYHHRKHNQKLDERLARVASCEFALRLQHHRHKGKDGWWNLRTCSIERLNSLAISATERSDHLDA